METRGKSNKPSTSKGVTTRRSLSGVKDIKLNRPHGDSPRDGPKTRSHGNKPPSPSSTETPARDTPQVPSATFSTTDGRYSTGIDSLIVNPSRIPLCDIHKTAKVYVPGFATHNMEGISKERSDLIMNPRSTVDCEIRSDVEKELLNMLKYFKERRSYGRIEAESAEPLLTDTGIEIPLVSDSDAEIESMIIRANADSLSFTEGRINTEGSTVSISFNYDATLKRHTVSDVSRIQHHCYACYDQNYRRQRRVNVDYAYKFHKIDSSTAIKFSNRRSFNTVIYAPEGSGKTTFCTMSRFMGFRVLECNNIFKWPKDTSNFVILTSKPELLEQGNFRVVIKPSPGIFYRRQDFRRKVVPNFRGRDYSIYNTIPPDCVILHTDKMLCELFN